MTQDFNEYWQVKNIDGAWMIRHSWISDVHGDRITSVYTSHYMTRWGAIRSCVRKARVKKFEAQGGTINVSRYEVVWSPDE